MARPREHHRPDDVRARWAVLALWSYSSRPGRGYNDHQGHGGRRFDRIEDQEEVGDVEGRLRGHHLDGRGTGPDALTHRKGGRERQTAPHIVYPEASCPHDHCDQPMQAIDFRLEDHGRVVHDPLVRAWWDDTGFAGACPRCDGWRA